MNARRSGPRALRAKSPRGFTLIELMVALMVFTIGALAMMSSSSSVMKMMAGSKRRTVAALVAESRFERLRAQPCTAHANGTALTHGVRESWTVVPYAYATDVTVLITFPAGGGRIISQTYRSYVAC